MAREEFLRRAFAVYVISLSLAAASLFCGQVHAKQPEKTGNSGVENKLEWLRGSGKDLRIRLKGKVLAPNGDPAEGFTVKAMRKSYPHPNQSLEPQVYGSEFEVWMPVNDSNGYRVDIQASSADGGQVACKWLMNYDLRKAAVEGVTLKMQPTSREVEVSVVYDGKPVEGARVSVEPVLGMAKHGRSDKSGVARFRLLPQQKLSRLHAWTDDFKIGGYSFSRTPRRDAKANHHVIELSSCRKQKLRFVDGNNSPVPNVKFLIGVATPPPYFNSLGNDQNSHLRTDEKGEAFYHWFPDWESFRCYITLEDNEWIRDADQSSYDKVIDDAIVVKLKKSRFADRKQVVGRVKSADGVTGGFLVLLSSFQGEIEHHIDLLNTFTDDKGAFFVKVLPDANYCAYVNDGRWVSETVDLVPYDSAKKKTNSPELNLTKGTRVEVVVTAGSDKKPVANQWINMRSPHSFKWRENGRTRRGSGGRSWGVITDDEGRVFTYAHPGKLKAGLYLDDRVKEKTIEVVKGKPAVIKLHLDFIVRRKVTGKLVLAESVDTSLGNAEIQIGSVDGESSDRQTLSSDKQGAFAFETNASELGIFAHTKDGKAAGSAVVKDFDSPVELKLFPTRDYHGKLLGKNGNPLVGHAVRTIICVSGKKDYSKPHATSFNAKTIEALTDAEGNYTLKGVPVETVVYIRADAIDGSKHDAYLGKVYLDRDDDRPRAVSRLAGRSGRSSEIILAEKISKRQRDCDLSGYHLMVIMNHPSADSFVDANFMDHEKTKEIYSFMQVKIPCGEKALKGDKAEYVQEKGWSIPEGNQVFACAIDGNGDELGRIEIDVKGDNAAEETAEFIRAHAPAKVKAKKKWKEAFAEAKRTNRKVWARVSQRYCGPCFALSRWLDDHKEILSKDYVMVKIDDYYDKDGGAVANRLIHGRHVGVPFFAIFDQDEKMLVDSESPIGNLGHPDGYEGKKHLRKMLNAARVNITDEEVDKLIDSLSD